MFRLALDGIAVDLLRPVPVEVGHRLEAADAGALQAAGEAAAGALGGLGAGDLLEKSARGPAGLGGAGEEIVERFGGGVQAEVDELARQIIRRIW